MSQKKTYLSFEKQEKLLNDLKKGKKAKVAIMNDYQISEATYYRYLNQALHAPLTVTEEIPISLKRKKFQTPKYHEVEDELLQLFLQYRSLGYPISGPLLRLIAVREAKKLVLDESIPQNIRNKYSMASFGKSWLKGFKLRNNIRGNIRINGERASLPNNIDELMAPIVEKINSCGIPPCNIYNWDETGLFYRAMPRYTLALANDDGAGCKEDIKRITVMMSVNGDVSDTNIIIIGVAKKPRGTSPEFFANHNVRYFNNKTAWMTTDIFQTLLKEFDAKMTAPTIILLDNFSGHTVDPFQDYNHIIPVFLPPKTTSRTQPLDAGIIATFKVKYRYKLMDYVLEKVRNNCFRVNDLTIARCTSWISEAAKEIQPSTIKKCFFRTLNLEMFKSPDVTDIDPHHELELLQNKIQEYIGDESKLTPLDVIDFVMDNEFMADVHTCIEHEDDDEDVLIPDAKKLLEGTLSINDLRIYLRNTGCHQEEIYLNYILEKIQKHLNFEE